MLDFDCDYLQMYLAFVEKQSRICFIGEINKLRRLVIATQARSQIHQTQLTAKLFTRDLQNPIKTFVIIFICFENKLVNCFYDVINQLNLIAFEFNLKAKIVNSSTF